MQSSKIHRNDQRRADDTRADPEPHTLDAARKVGTLRRFVDPYDMRAEPQPEEPGYGHGV